MAITVIIPARYASTRLAGKSLLDIAGKPMITHVVNQAILSQADRVIVATDDERIAQALKDQNCEVCMTKADHPSGSDRLAEVVTKLNFDEQDIVVNVQGDEPMIPPQLIDQVATTLANASNAVMSTAAHAIENQADIDNPNVVKVVFDQDGKALYFSRAAIPFDRDGDGRKAWRHIGIYAYRAGFLKRYHQLIPSVLEQSEKLEQLRVMDNGESIVVQTIDYDHGIGVDTQQDLDHVRARLQK